MSDQFITADLVSKIRLYAEDHYADGGWDVIVECWTDAQIAECIGRSKTWAGALRNVADIVGVFADRQADARNSAF